MVTERAFEPAPPFSGGTPRDTRAAAKCQENPEPATASADAFGIVAHGVKPSSDCAAMVLKDLAFLTQSTEMPAATPAVRASYDRLEPRFRRPAPRSTA